MITLNYHTMIPIGRHNGFAELFEYKAEVVQSVFISKLLSIDTKGK